VAPVALREYRAPPDLECPLETARQEWDGEVEELDRFRHQQPERSLVVLGKVAVVLDLAVAAQEHSNLFCHHPSFAFVPYDV